MRSVSSCSMEHVVKTAVNFDSKAAKLDSAAARYCWPVACLQDGSDTSYGLGCAEAAESHQTAGVGAAMTVAACGSSTLLRASGTVTVIPSAVSVP